MIKYNLICEREHEFESWFSNSEEFEKLKNKGLLECIYCNSKIIDKSIMAPMISVSKNDSINKSEINNNILQKERNKLLQSVAKQRSQARNTLLKNLNPIINDYMKEKKIRMVVDKKSLLLADENLDITKDIMNLLNQKLKSINLK